MNNDRFKFRVWDNINKRYDKSLDLIDKDGDLCYQDGGKYCNGEHPDDFTIEQCTGLKDKNGKLIYEGDVLGFYIKTRPVYVQWDSDKCRFVLRRFDIEGWEISLIQDTASRYTIIGNIHENR